MRQSRPVPKDKTDVGVRPTPDAHRGVACRGSRDKKQDQHEMRRVRTARKGVGPAERVRSRSARMQHCDKAGLNARLEIAGGGGKLGEEIREPNISTRASCCKSPRSVPPTPHLKKRDCEGNTSQPRERLQKSETRWRHRPSPSTLLSGFPPHWYEKIVTILSPPGSH